TMRVAYLTRTATIGLKRTWQYRIRMPFGDRWWHGSGRWGTVRAMALNELIRRAEAVLHPQSVGGRLFGDVAAALCTRAGNVYVGVCIDTASGTGFCAEHSAIAAMVTAGELEIAQIVAVWKDEDDVTHVLAPCGRWRRDTWARQPVAAAMLSEDAYVAGTSPARSPRSSMST